MVLVNDWLCMGESRGLNDAIFVAWVCLERILSLCFKGCNSDNFTSKQCQCEVLEDSEVMWESVCG